MWDILEPIKCALIAFTNLLMDVLASWWVEMLIWALGLLPTSPFTFEEIAWGEFGKLIGYFVPIADMMTHFLRILGIVVLWYAIQHIQRLLKLIR